MSFYRVLQNVGKRTEDLPDPSDFFNLGTHKKTTNINCKLKSFFFTDGILRFHAAQRAKALDHSVNFHTTQRRTLNSVSSCYQHLHIFLIAQSIITIVGPASPRITKTIEVQSSLRTFSDSTDKAMTTYEMCRSGDSLRPYIHKSCQQ